jgi:hypothetical protein
MIRTPQMIMAARRRRDRHEKNSKREVYHYNAHSYNKENTRSTFTADENRGLELLERILAAKDRKPFSKRLLVDTIGFESTLAVEIMRILLQHNIHPINEDDIMVAAGDTGLGAEKVALLLSHSEDTNITERMMLEAAKNSDSPVLSLFLQQHNHSTVTEEIIKTTISGNPGVCANPWLVQHVLAFSGGLVVSEETLMLAMSYDDNGGELLKIFLEHQYVPVTANLIEAALRTGGHAAGLLHVLFTHGQNMPVPVEQELRDQVYAVLENYPEASEILANLGSVLRRQSTFLKTMISLRERSKTTFKRLVRQKSGDCSTSKECDPPSYDPAVCMLEDVVHVPSSALERCPTCLNLQEYRVGYVVWDTLCSSAEAGCRYCFVIQQGVQHTSQVEICPNQELTAYVGQAPGPLMIQVLVCAISDCCPHNKNLDWRDGDNVHRIVDLYMHEGTSFFLVTFSTVAEHQVSAQIGRDTAAELYLMAVWIMHLVKYSVPSWLRFETYMAHYNIGTRVFSPAIGVARDVSAPSI